MRTSALPVVFLACLACAGSAPETDSKPISAPIAFMATTDLVGSVRLDWDMAHGAEPVKFVVWRDDAPLAELSGDARFFEDETGDAGVVGAPSAFLAEAGSGSVLLSWRPAEARPGTSHRYVIGATYEGGVVRNSDEAVGARAAPAIDGYRLLRDGDLLANLPPSAHRYEDLAADPGALTVPTWFDASTKNADGVMLSWDPDVSHPGTTHSYVLVAVAGGGHGLPAEAAGGRAAPTITGFEFRRDGGPWVDVGLASSHFDVGAPHATIRASAVVIPDRALGFVELAFSEGPTVVRPEPSTFDLRATSEEDPGPTASTEGSRGVGNVVSMQWQRDDGQGSFEDMAGAVDRSHLDLEAKGQLTRYRVLLTAPGASASAAEAEGAANLYSKLSAGDGFTCGVRSSDGAIRCWGFNGAGNAPPILGDDSFVDVSAGRLHACGVRRDGKVLCWGENRMGQAPPGPSDERYLQVSAGDRHTCGLKADGLVECWGALKWKSDEAFASISSGADHACGIRVDDRRVVCRGANLDGQAPPGPSADSFIDLSAGASHTCGIRDRDRRIHCWGAIHGDPPDEAFRSVSAGLRFTCGIRASDGKRVCWGANEYGMAPDLPSAEAFSSLEVGSTHGCGIRHDDGKVVCWGTNHVGEAPIYPSMEAFETVAAGGKHTCGIRKRDGRAVCWGADDHGQAPPQPIADSFVDVVAGDFHSCGLREDGRVVCWGRNDNGQAPLGPSEKRYQSISAFGNSTCGVLRESQQVECFDIISQVPDEPLVAIGGGIAYSCGIRKADMRVSCWANGAKVAGPGEEAFLDLSVGTRHGCGLRLADDSVVCWGSNDDGQASPPPMELHSISAGGAHTCGIRKLDGTAVCWGKNDDGQAPSEVGAEIFRSVSAGGSHTCAVRSSDGRVFCWGADAAGGARYGRATP